MRRVKDRVECQLTDFIKASDILGMEKWKVKNKKRLLEERIIHHMDLIIKLLFELEQNDIVRVSAILRYVNITVSKMEKARTFHLHAGGSKEIHRSTEWHYKRHLH